MRLEVGPASGESWERTRLWLTPRLPPCRTVKWRSQRTAPVPRLTETGRQRTGALSGCQVCGNVVRWQQKTNIIYFLRWKNGQSWVSEEVHEKSHEQTVARIPQVTDPGSNSKLDLLTAGTVEGETLEGLHTRGRARRGATELFMP